VRDSTTYGRYADEAADPPLVSEVFIPFLQVRAIRRSMRTHDSSGARSDVFWPKKKKVMHIEVKGSRPPGDARNRDSVRLGSYWLPFTDHPDLPNTE
jgi:hypothetical protein